MKTIPCLLLATILLLAAHRVRGQGFSFESGVDDWTVSGFNAQPVALGVSSNGATDGLQSFAITQTGGGFSWNAMRNNSGMDAFYTYMNEAALAPALYTLDMDVTYRDADIPDAVSFLNLSLWLNSDAGFKNVHGLGLTSGHEDLTIHLSVPLTDFGAVPLAPNSSFFQMGIGMNGNWGSGPATAYFDNISLVPVPEPSGIAIISIAALLWIASKARRRTN